jgi:hypothetical protein
MKILTAAAIALAIMLSAVGPVLAVDAWVVTWTQTGDNTWNYTVQNKTDNLTATGLDLFWSDATTLDDHPSTLGSPDGWLALDPALPDNWWVTVPGWQNDDSTTRIGPYGLLTGFTVTADTMPDSYTIYAIDSDGHDVGENPTGSVLPDQASAAPEPGSMAALFSGLVAIGGAYIKRRRA